MKSISSRDGLGLMVMGVELSVVPHSVPVMAKMSDFDNKFSAKISFFFETFFDHFCLRIFYLF